jgi:ABC-2 type transport system permease protein
MFLTSPRRQRAMLAQLAAVAVIGGLLALVGAGLTIAAVALALSTTDYAFMVPAADVVRILAASTFAGAAGAVLGGGVGAVVRNTGGAVTGAVLLLIIAPPLAVQLANDAASWIPTALATVLSGVGDEVSVGAAIAAISLWAMVPAAIGLLTVQRRDVV